MNENFLSPLTSQFQVQYRYSVQFTKGIFDLKNPSLRDFLISEKKDGDTKKALVVLDQGLISHYPNLVSEIKEYFNGLTLVVQLTGDIMVIPGGEVCKNDPQHWDSLVKAVDLYGIDRHSYMIAIGGGAILDLVGYVAAVSHRGIRLIRIPTTVLSQNDSGVGVKNSINYHGKKTFSELLHHLSQCLTIFYFWKVWT